MPEPVLNVRISTAPDPGNATGRHYHENTNLVFILNGGCTEKRQNITFERLPSDISLLYAGEKHETIFSKQPARYMSLDAGPGLFNQYGIHETQLSDSITRSPDAKFLMLKIYHALLDGDHSADTIHMLFLEFVVLSKGIKKGKHPPAWARILYELLQDKWDETITLNELSLVSGVSPITISKHFPSYFGCTLSSYIRKLKIEQSLSILKGHCTSLTATAYQCNFADQSHFSRTFKQLTSFTPKVYQKL